MVEIRSEYVGRTGREVCAKVKRVVGIVIEVVVVECYDRET